MAGSHTDPSAREAQAQTATEPSPFELVSTAEAGLSERLAGRVDGHLEAFAEHMREGLLAASTAVGLEVMAELIDAEVTEIAGPKGRHDPHHSANRHGTEAGSVALGGRRVPVRRPRVRTVARDDEPEREVALESYDTFAESDLLAEGIVARMLAGISTRRYPVSLEPVGADVQQRSGSTSKSAVSRRFVTATAERLAELESRPLDKERWLVVFIDGFGFADHTLVGALGVTDDGVKVPLGWWRAPRTTPRCAPGWWPGWPSVAWTPPGACCSWSTHGLCRRQGHPRRLRWSRAHPALQTTLCGGTKRHRTPARGRAAAAAPPPARRLGHHRRHRRRT